MNNNTLNSDKEISAILNNILDKIVDYQKYMVANNVVGAAAVQHIIDIVQAEIDKYSDNTITEIAVENFIKAIKCKVNVSNPDRLMLSWADVLEMLDEEYAKRVINESKGDD